MEKKYQVFISSTYKDLEEERKEVIQALLELDCIPAGMELFQASDDTQWDLIKRVIDDCDYYIVIIAGRYGSVHRDSKKSYTQMEYEYALEKGIPIIGFLHKEPSQIPTAKSETDKGSSKKLDEFRALVSKKMVRHWTTAHELGSAVSRSLIQLKKTHPAVGWVKASEVSTDEYLSKEIIRLNKENTELKERLDAVSTIAPKNTEDLAQGKDLVSIDGYFNYKPTRQTSKTITYTEELTWEDLFSCVAPHLIIKCSENDMKKTFDSFVTHFYLSKHPNNVYPTITNYHILGEDFNTLKVQLMALGLIMEEGSFYNSKVAENFWKLTPYGASYMLKLKAIKHVEL